MRGVLGVFPYLDATVEAIEELKRQKLGPVTVYTPTPRHEIEHAVHAPRVGAGERRLGAAVRMWAQERIDEQRGSAETQRDARLPEPRERDRARVELERAELVEDQRASVRSACAVLDPSR